MLSRKDGASKVIEPLGANNLLSDRQQARVVIIGAGLAGLAAAQRLYESGVEDVLLLDAQDRIGGRVHTIEHGDYVLELGAQWLHGADENPLYKWLTELGMLEDFEDASLGFRGLFCTPDGSQIDVKLVERVLNIVCASKLSLSKNPSFIDIINNRGLKNAGEVFRHQLELHLCQDEELAGHRTLVEPIFEWFLRYETIENCCDSMSDVSISSYTDWTDWGDGTLLNFKQGYRSLLSWFCRKFPAKKCIQLNRQVVQVELARRSSQEGKAVLVHHKHSSSVDSKHQTIECSHVIVTCSLGFLKQNHNTFFKPPLSVWRRNLIESIGFGTVNKIILQFEGPFWPREYGLKLVWGAGNDHDSTNLGFPDWARDIISFDVVRRQPNLLIGWIGGQGAKELERWDDRDVGQICIRIIERFLPQSQKRPTRLVACFCSRWNSNPFICGSYSFRSMQCFDLNVDKLQEPIYGNSDGITLSTAGHDELLAPPLSAHLGPISRPNTRVPRILFAGEATAGKLYSTTHGAIITGWREADRITDLLLSNNQPLAEIRVNQISTSIIN